MQKNQNNLCKPAIWSGVVSGLTNELVDRLRSLPFNDDIAWDPNKQCAYEPLYAKGARSSSLAVDSPDGECLLNCFERHVLPEIFNHDPRFLKQASSLIVLRLVAGNELPWHDDLGGKRLSDGTVENAAYSCLIYLDDADGGVLECVNPNTNEIQQYHPRIGRYVAFSSNVKHRVTSLTSKFRHAVLLRLSVV